MPYLAEFTTVALIHLLGAISPGPDFAMIARNSFKYSRKTALYSALGLALGILVHVAYSLIGVGFIISQSIVLFSVIKLLGAGYLIYIGLKSLRAQSSHLETVEIKEIDINRFEALKQGFLTNALNPKVTLLFFSLFSQIISPQTPLFIKIMYGIEMSTATFIWFALVAYLISHSQIKGRFQKFGHYIERFTGAVLILFGLKLAFSKAQ